MDIAKELEAIGLSEEQYEACLNDIQDKLNGVLDIEWEELKTKYNLPMTSDSLRKSQSRPFGGAFVKEYFQNNAIINTHENYIEQMSEIRKQKQRLFDERSALNKINRERGRLENDLRYLIDCVKERSYTTALSYYDDKDPRDNDLIICLSDIHFGMDAESSFGAYNSEIAFDRMGQYVKEIVKIQSTHHSENAYVLLGGDLINGNIHITTQLQNRENIIEQIQGVSELISVFLWELSKYFKTIFVNGVSGNHSRIGKKDEVLRSERLDDLVPWYIQAKLNNVKNINFCTENYDNTIAMFDIRGKKYLGVHGDQDRFSEDGMAKLVMMIGYKPEAILYGHLHKCSYDDISGVRMVRSGSFAGTVDDYTISKRLTGRPSQMVCVVTDNGIQALYPVELK